MTGVVVLGMHRSGTSLVSQLTGRLGAVFCRPDDLLCGTEHGRHTSYWESRSLVLFNESLLRAFGGDWAKPPALAPDWESSPLAEGLAPRGRQLFWELHPPTGWAWKDPRLSLTLPFWLTWVLSDARAVLVVRHPAEVAASLERRDGIGAEHALWLWHRYMASAVLACRDTPTLVMSYARLCQDPLATGESLRRWISPAAVPDEAVVRAAVADVRNGPVAAGAPGPRPAPEAMALYDALERMHGRRLEVSA
jgi:hypothetical protein